MNASRQLYKQNYIDKDFERLELFILLQKRYGINSALYPGCYVHVTPSLVYPLTVYADTDRRAKKFFADPWTRSFIEKNRRYPQKPVFRFHQSDYTGKLEEELLGFDLLISQYAGFVSRHCKQYLKPGGLLLVNNSHGDASLASLDGDYRFIAAVDQRAGKFRLIDTDPERYFVPKSKAKITPEQLVRTRRGVGYTKTAWAYLFRLVRARP